MIRRYTLLGGAIALMMAVLYAIWRSAAPNVPVWPVLLAGLALAGLFSWMAARGDARDLLRLQLDIETLIALMRARQREESLREQTRLVDQGRAENRAYEADARKLSKMQYDLAADIRPIERRVRDPKLRRLVEKVGGEMMNAGMFLRKPQTDATTIAIETEIIELLANSVSAAAGACGGMAQGVMQAMGMQPGMGSGAGPKGGGSSAGGSADGASPVVAASTISVRARVSYSTVIASRLFTFSVTIFINSGPPLSPSMYRLWPRGQGLACCTKG